MEINPIESRSPQKHNRRNRAPEPKTRLQRLRSIKVSRSFRRRATPDSDYLAEMLSSVASNMKEPIQEPARTLTRRSSFKREGTLMRLSSLKFRGKPSTRRVAGGTQMGRKPKSVPSQASPSHSDSSFSFTDQQTARVLTMKPKRASSGKTGTLKNPGPSTVSATCSSALKNAKVPDHVNLHIAETAEEDTSSMKVCPYSYCSLHGHHGDSAPPLKRYLSMRRRRSKSQKSINPESGLPIKPSSVGKKKQPRKRMSSPHRKEVDGDSSVKVYARPKAHTKEIGTQTADEDIIEAVNNGETWSTHPDHSACNLADEIPQTSPQVSRKVNDSEHSSENLKPRNLSDLHEPSDGSNTAATDHFMGCRNDSPAPVSKPKKESNPSREDMVTCARAEYKSSQTDFPCEVSETDRITDLPNDTRLGKQKLNSLWGLIYQSLVSDISTSEETNQQTIGEEDKVREQEHGSLSIGMKMKNMVPDREDCEEDQDVGVQKIELTETDAVKLVQEAISKILSSKFQYPSSDDHSTAEIQDPDSHRRIKDESQEARISTSLGSSQLADDSSAEERTVLNKYEQRPSNRWRNLKKLVLLKKFIKTLEKVRKFGPNKRTSMDSEPGSVAEMIQLRHQTVEERRNSEEWMLDRALQQVISKLAPAQKRRVELLIQAFETLTPQAEGETAPSTAKTFQPRKGSGKEYDDGNFADISHQMVSLLDKNVKENSDVCISPPSGLHNDLTIYELGIVPKHSGKPGEIAPSFESNLACGSKKLCSSGDYLEHGDCSPERKDPKSCHQLSLVPDDINCRCNEEIPAELEALRVSTKQKNAEEQLEHASLKGCPGPKGPEIQRATDEPHGSQTERQKQMKLWLLAYKHMASSLSMKDGTEQENEEVGNARRLHEARFSDPSKDSLRINGGLGEENHEGSQRREPYHVEAVKLVEQAIDDIFLTDSEDQLSDDQSISSYTVLDQELLEKEQDREGESYTSSFKEFNKTNGDNSGVAEFGGEEEDRVSNGATKFKQNASNRWRNLKKVVLLKRFVKGLEKSSKLKLVEPRNLALEPQHEAENVNLRHNETEERKNAEEWMLDYALQRAVTKLTPARKRKVQLLVEAFETVIPNIGLETC